MSEQKPRSPRWSRRALLQSVATVAALSPFGVRAANTGGQDRLVVDGLDTSIVNEGFLDLLREGGVDCVHKSIGNLDHIADLYGFAHRNRDEAVIATTVREIHQARAVGKLSIIMGAQEASFFEAALFGRAGKKGSFSAMAKSVRDFKGIGVGIQGLCYNVTNVFGSGCLNPEGPLTRAGRRVVDEIHKQEMVLDVGGHCAERTSFDAIEMSSGVPIVCTHTNFASLNPNMRAISDRLAESIAATGGAIGITAVSAFHNRNASTERTEDVQATLDVHLDQYDYAKKLVGVDHVGLGPDFVWGWGESYEHDPEDSAAFPFASLPTGKVSTVKDFENISKLPNLIEGLRGRGWTDSELDKLLGMNWLRIYEKVWGA